MLTGDRAARLRELVAPGEDVGVGGAAALGPPSRPAGPLTARVEEARVTPDQIRLQLDVDGAGSLPGVADPGSDVRVGARVRVSIDTSRIALIPSDLSGGRP